MLLFVAAVVIVFFLHRLLVEQIAIELSTWNMTEKVCYIVTDPANQVHKCDESIMFVSVQISSETGRCVSGPDVWCDGILKWPYELVAFLFSSPKCK